MNQEMAQGCLKLLGCDTRLVCDGVEALAALERESYDVVLMDCRMPAMDGLSATRELRAREYREVKAPTTVIALTANALGSDRDACLEAGMDDYLSKPFTLAQLRTKLDRWLPEACPPSAREAADAAGPGTGEPEVSAADSEELAVLDAGALGQIRALQAGAEENVLERVVNLYVRSSGVLLETMSLALEDDDAGALRDAAHTLKTASANVGASALSELCRTLEHSAEAADPGTRQLVASLETEFARVRRALVAECTKNAA